MPYPHYTEEEKINAWKIASSVDKASLLNPKYWFRASEVFQEAYPCFGNDGIASHEPFQLIIAGKFRNGNGERFPADWDGEDICAYIYEKEQARKERETARKNGAAARKKDAEEALKKENAAQKKDAKETIVLDEMGLPIPDEKPRPAPKAEVPPMPEEEQEPDFLLYDEEKKCFIGLTTKNFYQKKIRSSIEKTGEINLGNELLADDNPKMAERSNALKRQLLDDVVADAAEAVTDLFSDLRKRDSIFSSNSKEYKDFYNGLKKLRDQLVDENDQPRHFDSLDQLKACFNDPENDVYKLAGDYLSKKMTQKDKLSDRQIDRMSMCRRFRSIDQAVGKAVDDAKEGKFADCRTEIINSTAAHKSVLGIMKNVGPTAVEKAFRSSAVYQDQFNRTKEIFEKNRNPFRVAKDAKAAPSAKTEFFKASKKWKVQSYGEEDYREQVKRLAEQGPDKAKMAVIAEFMLKRTHGMLEELKANDSFLHSDEQKRFRKGVEDLHEDLVGMFAKDKNPSKQGMLKKIEDVSKLAEAYQLRHFGDTAGKADMKTVHRLGVAAEIRIMRDYFANTDEKDINPADLFKRVKAHQDLMRELNVRRSRLVNESIDYNFLSADAQESAEYKKAAGAFTRAFNRLINAAGYSKVVDERVAKLEKDLPKEDKDLIPLAVTENKSLKAIKKGIADGTIIVPVKESAAPEAGNAEPENAPKELGGTGEELLK